MARCSRKEGMKFPLQTVLVLLLAIPPMACIQTSILEDRQYSKNGHLLPLFYDIPVESMTDEQRLLYHLLKSYDRASRPVFDASMAVTVRLGITLTQILDVDEKNQVLTTNIWLDQEWMDERLVWNSTKFNGIEIIRIPCDLIWLPDIVLYNSVDNHNKGYMKSLSMVQSSGNVFWPPIVRMRSSCKLDITYFPFDDQICLLKLGSWAYDGFQVDVVNRTMEMDLSNYVDNGEWTLINTKMIRNVKIYPCCPEPFPDVTFYIHIRRRVLYYAFNVMIPCMLLSSLSLTGFCLPPDSGEKVTLGLTVLLAFSVFMLLIAENMPPTSEYVPLIGIYLTVVMAMSALSVVLSVFVLNIHHRGGMIKRPPTWLRRLSNRMSNIFCMNVNFMQEPRRAPSQSYSVKRLTGHSDHTTLLTANSSHGEMMDSHDIIADKFVEAGDLNSPRHDANKTPSRSKLEKDILEYFNYVMSSNDQAMVEKQTIYEWQEVARVIDKFFFWLFVTISSSMTIFLLIISPMTKQISIEV